MGDYKDRQYSGKLHISGSNPGADHRPGEEDYRGYYGDNPVPYRGDSGPVPNRGDYRSDSGPYRGDYRSGPDPYRGDYQSGPDPYRGDYRSNPDPYRSHPEYGRRDYSGYDGRMPQPPRKKSKILPILLGCLVAVFTAIIVIGLVFFIRGRQIGGTYTAIWDMKDMMNEEALGLMRWKSLDVEIYLVLNKDGTYHLYNDEEQIKEALVSGLDEDYGFGIFTDKESFEEGVSTYSDSMANEEYGSYELYNGRKNIRFTPDSGSDIYEGTVSGDGSIVMTIPYNDETLELVFKK